MTKTLEQIQQENRRFILEAIHRCDYDEALKKELGFNCEVIARVWHHPQRHIIDNLICYFDGDYLRFKELVGDISRRDLTETGLKNLEDYESTRHRITEIIGKPITLSRVLSAINAKGGFYDPIRLDDESNTLNFDYQGLSFNLDVETLEEQSEETQRFLNKFFND